MNSGNYDIILINRRLFYNTFGKNKIYSNNIKFKIGKYTITLWYYIIFLLLVEINDWMHK